METIFFVLFSVYLRLAKKTENLPSFEQFPVLLTNNLII